MKKIGEGPFGASSHGISQETLQGLIVLGRNLRAELVEKKRPQVLLGLQKDLLKNTSPLQGEKLFLDREEASSSLHFRSMHRLYQALKVERAAVTIEVCKKEGERR